jgi:hypothetical protein
MFNCAARNRTCGTINAPKISAVPQKRCLAAALDHLRHAELRSLDRAEPDQGQPDDHAPDDDDSGSQPTEAEEDLTPPSTPTTMFPFSPNHGANWSRARCADRSVLRSLSCSTASPR